MINQRVSRTINFISWLGSILLLLLFSYLAWRGYQQTPTADVLQRWTLAFLASELLLLTLLSEVKRLIRSLLQEVKQSENLKRRAQIEAAEQLSKMASQLPGMVFQFLLKPDGSNSFMYCSDGISDIFNLTPEQVKDDAGPLFDRIHPADTQTVRDSIIAATKQLTLWKIEHRVQRPNGDIIWVTSRAVPERQADGSVILYGFASDFTERKQVERLKDEFVSTVSHELRTPLTAISGAIGLLHGEVFGPLPQQAAQMTQLAQANVKKLQLLINDLLDMDKLIAGKMLFDIQPQPLLPVIEASLHDNQSYAQQYQVRYELQAVSADMWVNVDSMRLQQVMANLLSNAAKFSPPQAVVNIIVQQQDDKALIRVIDSGCGISEQFKPYIFNKFSQADSSDIKSKGGTGLGLAISKQLMSRMQGEIGFQSEQDKGSEFYVLLPLVGTAELPEANE